MTRPPGVSFPSPSSTFSSLGCNEIFATLRGEAALRTNSPTMGSLPFAFCRQNSRENQS